MSCVRRGVMVTFAPAVLKAGVVPMIGAARKADVRVALMARVDPVAKVIGHSLLLVARETISHCLPRATTEIMRTTVAARDWRP
jgi:hypothetical protein